MLALLARVLLAWLVVSIVAAFVFVRLFRRPRRRVIVRGRYRRGVLVERVHPRVVQAMGGRRG